MVGSAAGWRGTSAVSAVSAVSRLLSARSKWWARAASRRRRTLMRRSFRTDRRKRTRISIVARSRGLQSSILRSGSRFLRCLCELRCLRAGSRSVSRTVSRGVAAGGPSGQAARAPWVKRGVLEALEDAHERQALALGAHVETEQLLLLPGRPWLLAPPPPGSRRRDSTAGATHARAVHAR